MKNFRNRQIDIGPVAREILSQFVKKYRLSTYQIYSMLKGGPYEMAYKNVHKRIQRLKNLEFIKKVEVKEEVKHGAKYYRLTERGIYQLILKIPRQGETFVYFKEFIEHYGNYEIFESLVYPYVSKETLLSISPNHDIVFVLIIELFTYLATCCNKISSGLDKISEATPDVKIIDHIGHFVETSKFTKFLREKLEFNNIDKSAWIVREGNGKNVIIRVKHPSTYAFFKKSNSSMDSSSNKHQSIHSGKVNDLELMFNLDNNRNKILITIANANKKYEFDIADFDFDIKNIFKVLTMEEFCIRIIDGDLYPLICSFIFKLTWLYGRLERERDDLQILCQDNRFMKIVDDVYHDVDSGYKKLMRLRMY